jgi:hypothetical protein
VIAARRLGAERIIISAAMPTGSRWHGIRRDRCARSRQAAIERVRNLTGGVGAHPSWVRRHRSGHAHGDIAHPVAPGRVGVSLRRVPREPSFANVTVSGPRLSVHTSSSYLTSGRQDRVFDRVVDLEQVPDGYRALNERKSIR